MIAAGRLGPFGLDPELNLSYKRGRRTIFSW